MTPEDVLSLYDSLRAVGISIWLDGGWGVDALLGEQTRPHQDLDIVVEQKDTPAVRSLLAGQGFADVPRGDTQPWNFVLGHPDGRLVDVHAVVLTPAGSGLYGPPDKGVMYPAGSLTGRGRILGREVACIEPGWMVRFHTGYPLRPSDMADVTALCRRFGIPLPPEYLNT